MLKYNYKMVQIPPSISLSRKELEGQEAASYLEKVVNQYAQQGWEFHRVDSIGVQNSPGCLLMLVGARESNNIYYVITFRRAAE